MKTFKLEIKTPEKLIFAGQVQKLNAIAADGQIGILPDHAPLATMLAKSQLRYTLEGGEEVKISGSEGFLIAQNNLVNVLLKS